MPRNYAARQGPVVIEVRTINELEEAWEILSRVIEDRVKAEAYYTERFAKAQQRVNEALKAGGE